MRIPTTAILCVLALASAPLAARAQSQDPALEHNLATRYAPGDKIALKAGVRGGADWVTLYYRGVGVTAFQARPMKNEADPAVYAAELDTSIFPAEGFEYYIEAEASGRKVSLPSGGAAGPAKVAPEGGAQVPAIPANLPSPQAEEAKFRLPVHANGSLQGAAFESVQGRTTVNPTGNGNLQIGFEKASAGGLGVRIDSNFSLTNAPPTNGRSFDLATMMVAVTLGSHALRMGDLSINETEYSSFGMGRRGIEYAFDSRTFYLHAFDVSTQQVMGFKGIGIPASSVGLLGGAAGVRLFREALFLKAVFVSGRDDPSQAANAAVSPAFQRRRGDAWSLSQETSLFRNVLKLRAEFARSSYDGNLDDDAGKTDDGAWSAGANLTLGPLSASAVYRSIGRAYNSIGLAYLANDRRGLETNFLLAAGRVSLQAQLATQEDNVEESPDRPTTRGLNGNASVNVSLGPRLSLTAGFRASNQRSRQGEADEILQDIATREFSSGFNWTASDALTLNMTLTRSSLSSQTAPSGDVGGTTLNLGGSLRVGETLLLSPTFGLTRSRNVSTGAVDSTLNGFLNGEVFFIPRILSLAASGSFNRMAAAVVAVNRSFDLIGGVNFYLGRLLKVNNLLIAVKGSYRRTEFGGQAVTDTRVLGQADFAF